jgi:hypothetical protein
MAQVGTGWMGITFTAPLPTDQWKVRFCWLVGEDGNLYDMRKKAGLKDGFVSVFADRFILNVPIPGIVYYCIQHP